MQVNEQVLRAYGIETCPGLIAKRGLLSTLSLPKTANSSVAGDLGIGLTQHMYVHLITCHTRRH